MPARIVFFLTCLGVLSSAALADESIVDIWKYTLKPPAEGWQKPEFDDTGWTEAPGGFGAPGTPSARIGTLWRTDQIWLRKSFPLDQVPDKPALLIHHDEDAEVFLNGVQVARFTGYTTEFKVHPLDEKGKAALKKGTNLLAVHCRQTFGGQFIDVHLIDAENVPKLPPAKRDPTPFQSALITPWGEKVTPENVWTEYPRPQLMRESWVNLNGQWDYAITPADDQEHPVEWAGKILVPFPLESKLSGVQRMLEPHEALWYRRTFPAKPVSNRRTLLNFEAVDYRCEVFLNGQKVGSHQGGNLPFSLDVTSALKSGTNELIVRVEDDTEEWQLRGKQVLYPEGIWYTQVSGIWQTVWLEEVAPDHITDLTIQTNAEQGSISITPDFANNANGVISVRVLDGDKVVAEAKSTEESLTIPVKNAKLWSPSSPHLYGLDITLLDDQGAVVDHVKSYAGIRSVGKTRDANGHFRFTLNGEVIFHWGTLDQGWWPDGLLTPPSDEAMLFDIEFLKAAGFNMIRKHIKVEPRRYYYHCDRLGMLLWQDQVSGGRSPSWTQLQPNPKDADWPEDHHRDYMSELEGMIDTLENHPSIVVWVPFNEAWGQHNTLEVGEWTVKRDPSRLVNVASGGNFWPVGDIVDAHSYPNPGFPFNAQRDQDFIMVVGEFGGHGYPVKGHLWDENRENWGYGGLPRSKEEYQQRYATSLNILDELRAKGIAGAVYTQTTDVEGEVNGLLTYDRKVIKIPAEDLARLHRKLFQPLPETSTGCRE